MVARSKQPLAELVAALPARFTASDRLTGIASEASGPFLEHMRQNPTARATFFADMPLETTVDLTDGLRVTFKGGDIIHLRPSGNAPEFRCYTEAKTNAQAKKLLKKCIITLKEKLN